MRIEQNQDPSTEGIELSEKYTLKDLREEYFIFLPGIAFCVLGKELLKPFAAIAEAAGKNLPLRYVTYQKDLVLGLSPTQANRMLFAIPFEFGLTFYSQLNEGVGFNNPQTNQICRLTPQSIRLPAGDPVLDNDLVVALTVEFPDFSYVYSPPIFENMPWFVNKVVCVNQHVVDLKARAGQVITEAKES